MGEFLIKRDFLYHQKPTELLASAHCFIGDIPHALFCECV